MSFSIATLKRFWPKVTKGDGCWTWNASCVTSGYGIFWVAEIHRQVVAHRVSWEIHFGPIPDGMNVCHHCDNRPCVRPDHLFLGTQVDNANDMVSKGRWRGGQRKTHCVHGHEYTEENTYYSAHGWRKCRTCINQLSLSRFRGIRKPRYPRL